MKQERRSEDSSADGSVVIDGSQAVDSGTSCSPKGKQCIIPCTVLCVWDSCPHPEDYGKREH